MKIDKREWAESKVEDYYHDGPEKVTLMAIAKKTKYTSGKAIVSRYRIARAIGKSTRTVQRHIQRLDKNGWLVVDRESRYEHRSSIYRIPLCSFTSDELAFMSYFSPGKWIRCVLDPYDPVSGIWIEDKLRTVPERQWETKRLLLGDKPSGNGSHSDSPPIILKQSINPKAAPIHPELLEVITPVVSFDWEGHLKSFQTGKEAKEKGKELREIRSRDEIESDIATFEALGADVAALRAKYGAPEP